MKTRNLIFAILWGVLALLMLVATIVQWYFGEMAFAMIAAIAFGCDSYSAWVHLGQWLEYRKSLKNIEK